MKPAVLSLTIAFVAASLAGCPGPLHLPVVPGPHVKEVSLTDVGLDPEAIDRHADPCSDFYQFACGNWIEKTQIPSDQPMWMRSFMAIEERNEHDIKAMLEAAAAPGGAHDDIAKKLGDFYSSCTDEAGIAAGGLGELKGLLDRVKALRKSLEAKGKAPPPPPPANKMPQAQPKAETLEHLVADLHRHGIYPFFDISSGPDDKQATMTIAQMDQNGLGLPERDYYLNDAARFKDIRGYYLDHVKAMLALAGDVHAGQSADDVMKLETRIATISKAKKDRRDPQGMYNKIDRAGLQSRSKSFDYGAYLDALVSEPANPSLGLKSFNAINVTSVPFFEGLQEILHDATPAELEHYLTWHILRAESFALPKQYDDEHFSFVQKITGQKEQKARWKRCVMATSGSLGELIGQAYVESHFTPESKDAVKKMLLGIRTELNKRFPQLAWMDPATRERAIAKLAKMEDLIGYPDKWREYPFAVDRSAFVNNALRADAFEVERGLAKIEKTVDRSEWLMAPQDVNAYYDANKNRMVFPAGILRNPFFDAHAALAVNMGAMGMVVGHEMTHGFDDQGSQYDGEGNLVSWWQPEVRKKFDDQASCLADQYSAYELLPGVKQDGRLTLGENIADNAGVTLALKAFEAMRKDASEVQVADGFDERQQFFLSVGQVWCAKQTDQIVKLRATTDFHANPHWRVNGSLRNLPAFAEAFHCQPGTPMHPANVCAVW